jgi:hypothetical protein
LKYRKLPIPAPIPTAKIKPFVLEKILERRDYEDQQDRADDERDDEHRGRVGEGLLDLFLDRLGLFLVRGDLVEQRLECTSLLTGLYEIDEQVVEIEWLLGESLGQSATALDVRLDAENQLLHRGILVAVADDFEGLYERDARSQHRGELAAEYGDIARGDLGSA